jgi:peptidoglycan pentaglycine glycine transferase (the first glycine)
MTTVALQDWETFVGQSSEAHILQTAAWGELKSAFGWHVEHISWGKIGAQILYRPLPGGFTIAYIPKGPLYPGAGKLDHQFDAQIGGVTDPVWSEFWADVDRVCKKQRAIFLKVEPDCWVGVGQSEETKAPDGFRLSGHAIQPLKTILVDLHADPNETMSRMKQKTRYNIRLASKKGVKVQTSQEVGLFHDLMEKTGRRDQFAVHSLSYYQKAYDLFYPRGECELWLASHEGDLLASLMAFCHGSRAWYLYGASSNIKRELMASYAIQWEAMLWARSKGCTEYDLWGIPDQDEAELERDFTQRSDGLWGVYRFKRGFGGVVRRSCGPWDRVYQSALYWLYRLWQRRVHE